MKTVVKYESTEVRNRCWAGRVLIPAYHVKRSTELLKVPWCWALIETGPVTGGTTVECHHAAAAPAAAVSGAVTTRAFSTRYMIVCHTQ